MPHTPPRSMAARAASLLAALLAVVLLAGCAGTTNGSSLEAVYVAAPFEAGETLRYEVADINGLERVLVGYGTLSVEAQDGRLALVQSYVEAETPEGGTPITDEVIVAVDPATFRPLSGERTITRRNDDGEASTSRFEWTYREDGGDDGDEPQLVVSQDDGDERTLRLRDAYYDNESSLWLWRSIDLVEEYEALYTSVNPIERSQQTVTLRVPQTETVTVPAGEFEAYRLLFRTGRAVRSAWIEAAAPHRILRWDNGETVMELLPAE